MYAVIETGGKQLKVVEGDNIYTELLDAKEGSEYVFDKVVLTSGKTTKIGTPYVVGAKVVAEVEKHGKQKKIKIFKYRAKSPSSHRRQGHRQPYTKLLIKRIEA